MVRLNDSVEFQYNGILNFYRNPYDLPKAISWHGLCHNA